MMLSTVALDSARTNLKQRREYSIVRLLLNNALFVTAVLFWVLVDGYAQAQVPSISITDSKLSEFKLLVLSGSRAIISNSMLCRGQSEGPCIIAVESGARLELANSVLGERLEIYGPKEDTSWLHLSNTDVVGRIRHGLPPDTSAVTARKTPHDREFISLKKFENTKLDNFNVTVGVGEAIHFSNSNICLKDGSTACFLILKAGAEFSATNTRFGRRVSLSHQEPYLTGLTLSNCELSR